MWRRRLRVLGGALLLGGLVAGAAEARGSPAERSRLARSGAVDPALVEALAEGDEARAIVVFDAPDPRPRSAAARARRYRHVAERGDAIARGIPEPDLRVQRRYRGVAALAGSVTRRGLLRLLEHPHVVRVGLDREVRALAAEGLVAAGFDALHAGGTYVGQAQQVAVIDTGIDTDHEDLASQLVAEQCFCAYDGGCCPPDDTPTASGPGSAEDDERHGTRVSGILVSNGTSAALGAAYGAEIVAIKVLNGSSHGLFSDVVAALDWVDTQLPDVDAVNLSLGGGGYTGECDDADALTLALADPIDRLWDRGVLSFAGSGNNGNKQKMIAPACLLHAVSVGATADEALGPTPYLGCTDPDPDPETVTCFTQGNATLDLVAPGALIATSKLGGGVADPAAGTSYATPFATGCALIQRQASPGLTAAQQLAGLKDSHATAFDPGNGLLFPRLACDVTILPEPDGPLALGAGLALVAALGRRSRRARPQEAPAAPGATQARR